MMVIRWLLHVSVCTLHWWWWWLLEGFVALSAFVPWFTWMVIVILFGWQKSMELNFTLIKRLQVELSKTQLRPYWRTKTFYVKAWQSSLRLWLIQFKFNFNYYQRFRTASWHLLAEMAALDFGLINRKTNLFNWESKRGLSMVRLFLSHLLDNCLSLHFDALQWNELEFQMFRNSLTSLAFIKRFDENRMSTPIFTSFIMLLTSVKLLCYLDTN